MNVSYVKGDTYVKKFNKIDWHEQLSKPYLTRSKSPLRQAVKTSSP